MTLGESPSRSTDESKRPKTFLESKPCFGLTRLDESKKRLDDTSLLNVDFPFFYL